MNCMKCGREIKEGQVFCQTCLDDMAHYPVQPDIVVQIPKQQKTQRKASRKHVPTPEEQLKRSRILIRWLIIIMFVLLAITACFGILALETLERYDLANLLGQNYSIVDDVSFASP